MTPTVGPIGCDVQAVTSVSDASRVAGVFKENMGDLSPILAASRVLPARGRRKLRHKDNSRADSGKNTKIIRPAVRNLCLRAAGSQQPGPSRCQADSMAARPIALAGQGRKRRSA